MKPSAIGSLLSSRATVLVALGVACWPVWRWYLARMSDGSDEPWGLAALAAALIFAPRKGWLEPVSRSIFHWLTGLLAIYVVSFRWIPPLGHGLLFVTMIPLIARPLKISTAWWGLLVLSLPLVATLQFYLGYPLRLATTALCVPLLRLGGIHAASEATALHWAGETVIVDAPCSGIHMLWTGLFLAASLACWQKFDARKTLQLLQRASAAVFVANVLRATALFCIEAKIWPAPGWAHEGAGLGLFAVAATFIYRSSQRLPPVEPNQLPHNEAAL